MILILSEKQRSTPAGQRAVLASDFVFALSESEPQGNVEVTLIKARNPLPNGLHLNYKFSDFHLGKVVEAVATQSFELSEPLPNPVGGDIIPL